MTLGFRKYLRKFAYASQKVAVALDRNKLSVGAHWPLSRIFGLFKIRGRGDFGISSKFDQNKGPWAKICPLFTPSGAAAQARRRQQRSHYLFREEASGVLDNIICWASRLERSFQTKQLLFTRRFLSVRVSRLASRLWAWDARKLLSGAARRMQIAGVAWNWCTLWTFALHAGRACNPREDGVVRTQNSAVAKAA